MMGPTGHRLIHMGDNVKNLYSPQNMVNIGFPRKTTVSSRALIDEFGRPTYRKDIRV